MSEQAAQVPLIELARAVPNDLCGEWQEIDGLRAWHHAPIGRYVHELCDQITELTARAERLQAELAKAEAERDELLRQLNDSNARINALCDKFEGKMRDALGVNDGN